MKQIINKKVVIVLLVVILLLILVSIYTNKGLIKQINSRTFKQEEEDVILDGISCRVLDNTGEKIKAFVTITRESGIEKIEYVASNENTIGLNCNNKPKVTIDIEILVNEEKQFKVTSNGEEKIETIRLKENYTDDYLKITKLDNEEERDQVEIEFNPVQPSLNYYKINEGPWVQYSSTISLDLSDINIEKLQTGENDTRIYAKSIDTVGNTLISSKTIELTKKYPHFDLFHNMEISGKTNLAEYGISGYWNYSHNTGVGNLRNFSVRNMGIYLRQGWSVGRNVSASFTVDISRFNIKANQLYFTAYHYPRDSASWTNGNATIYYSDGTSTSSTTNYLKGGATRLFTNNINLEDKQISHISFSLSGHANMGGFQLYIKDIIFKRNKRNRRIVIKKYKHLI